MPARTVAHAAAEIERRDLIEGLGKGLRVIEAFDEDHSQLTASQVAERADITRTAARRYLLSLVHFGYATTDGKQFWLAPRVLRLGQSYLGAARLPRLVQPFIQRVAVQIGHTVNASVLDGHEVVYIARSSPPRWVTIGYGVGVRIPAHVVTPGFVVLATLDDDAFEDWLDEHEFASFTPHTVVSRAMFRAQVRQARALGYWHTEQQLDAGLRGVAVALIDRKGRCRGAVGSTMPMTAYRSSEHMLKTVLPPLQEAAQALRPLL
ncbi:MAG: helix-turn-helix domain-containing protein [Aquincola sp.]|nr:helix-turn-helix domain-containing protein [Aquincola sp.]MDH4290413.1 helix-turn-helix domain-containing protein [Aquincola sp.]MDH5329272.1 helix-turn-helix domain-containing protein [Aquincola sp.]